MLVVKNEFSTLMATIGSLLSAFRNELVKGASMKVVGNVVGDSTLTATARKELSESDTLLRVAGKDTSTKKVHIVTLIRSFQSKCKQLSDTSLASNGIDDLRMHVGTTDFASFGVS